MSKPRKTDGKYLWWCLKSLEFKPDLAAKDIKRLNLGVNMFDKPNKEAFYIITHFLFEQLNPTRVQEVFRHCWPVFNHKHDVEFRKLTFGWLQEIVNEEGSAFPKVAASHLVSPFGPRLVNLMLHLAKHVMQKKMKIYSIDDVWVPEAAAVPASSLDLEMKRFKMVKRQFQRELTEQDRIIQDYQKRAKDLEKSLRDLNVDDAKYDQLLKEQDCSADLEGETLANYQKVRGLWAEIHTVSSLLEKDQKAVESVISGQADRYTLDGQDLNVKIPAVLRERLEQLSHQSNVGSLYEAGHPVLVRLLELLNEGLCILNEEREKIVGPTKHLHLQSLQEQVLLLSRSKENLKFIRRKLVKEDAVDIKASIRSLEEDWERKWAECLKNTPLTSFLEDEPVLDFVSSLAPLSFEPSSDDSFKASVISQYPHKLPKLLEQTSKRIPAVEETIVNSELEAHLVPERINTCMKAEDEMFLFSSDYCSSPRPDTPRMVVPCETPLTFPVKVKPPVVQTPSPLQASHRKTFLSTAKTSVMKNKAQILDLECDNLANQFADAVIMSPINARNDMDLGLLLNAVSDPFSTRKQLCRTPESLIKDVRSSWRKAVEEGVAEKKHASWNENDSLSFLKSPLVDAEVNRPSPEPLLLSYSKTQCASPPVQQMSSLHSTLSWDSSQIDALDSQSSSDVIKFSIAHEEIPELFEDEVSFNSDISVEMPGDQKIDRELFLLPDVSHSADGEITLPVTQQSLEDSFNKDSCIKSPVLSKKSSGLNLWPGDETLFSLELDKLESFSPPPAEKLSLPSLINVNFD